MDTMVETRCSRVTGSADPRRAFPPLPRLGNELPDGRRQVLCDSPATWIVDGRLACDRDLAAVADETGRKQFTVTRIRPLGGA